MSRFAWMFPGGKLVQTVTSVTLVNNTLKDIDTVVPTGKRWLLLSVKATNVDDVNRDIAMIIYKEAAKTNILRYLQDETVTANARSLWPSGGDGANAVRRWALVILKATNTVNVHWDAGGASAGGTDADGHVIEYLEIDAP